MADSETVQHRREKAAGYYLVDGAGQEAEREERKETFNAAFPFCHS